MPPSHRIAVIGLGYVGLPVAVAFAKQFAGTIGFDINHERVECLRNGVDLTNEIAADELLESGLIVTEDVQLLQKANIFIICVPTPIHRDRRPDLRPLESASKSVGSVLKKGDIVVYESTVYPGLTEDYCRKILAEVSGLQSSVDFKVGYSPERINPGDKTHTFDQISKIVSAEDSVTAEILASLYRSVISAEVHVAPSIKVAEAAKVLENTQRDLNIALMNELSIICDHLNIRTKDVLEAAKTKWNFLPFTPGLVGGHCIGVDPYYLTSKAQELGYNPEVILAGRRINDSMGAYIARRLVRFLGPQVRALRDIRIGVLGITFKENIPDIRNSRVPDILNELRSFGVSALIHDPLANQDQVTHEYGLNLSSLSALSDLDGLILAVPHTQFLSEVDALWPMMRDDAIIIDVKSALSPKLIPSRLRYWSL